MTLTLEEKARFAQHLEESAQEDQFVTEAMLPVLDQGTREIVSKDYLGDVAAMRTVARMLRADVEESEEWDRRREVLENAAIEAVKELFACMGPSAMLLPIDEDKGQYLVAGSLKDIVSLAEDKEREKCRDKEKKP